jgi:SprB repeat
MKSKFLLILLCSLVRIHALLADDVSAQVYNETSAGASNGQIILTMAGGIAPYSFSWSGSNGYTASTQNISNLRAGNYNVTINDAYCGTATLNIVVEVCSLIATTETTGTCGNDLGSVSIQLQNGAGPYTYSMRSSFRSEPGISDSPIAQNLPAGSYSMRIVDAKGCKVNASFNIVQSPILAAHLESIEPSVLLMQMEVSKLMFIQVLRHIALNGAMVVQHKIWMVCYLATIVFKSVTNRIAPILALFL